MKYFMCQIKGKIKPRKMKDHQSYLNPDRFLDHNDDRG